MAGRSSRRRGSVEPWGPGRWRVRLSFGAEGKQRRRLSKIIYGSKADAERYLNAAVRRREQNDAVVLSRQALGAWVDEWLTTWCNRMAPRTRADYEGIFRRYLTPELRARKLSELTAADVQHYVNDLVAAGLGPRTVAMAHGAIRACLTKAVKLGKVPRNVARDAELPRKKHTERVVFGPDEARRFCDAVLGDKWEAFFILMVYSGLRPSEALGLLWSDLDGSVLRVRRSLVRVPGQEAFLEDTKTPRGRRVIPLAPEAMDALQRHRRTQVEWRLRLGGAYRDRGLIFANEEGGFADLHNITGRHFKPILKAAGLRDLRLYDLRHTHATLLMASGEHPKVVQERLGHASITLTLDIYSHVVPGMQERASQRLSDLLSPSRAVVTANA
ncbi:MAG TPA: site-specific integrase [Gemmatimonadaceae bacterium]|nr:site-specific integrase [Gemmatimonadaceae bacterium]